MVVEIECPHCHNKVTPKHGYSSITFAMLLLLGLIPFILYTIGYVMLWNVLIGLLKTISAMQPTSPTGSLDTMFNSFGILSIAGVIFILAVGIIPALVYWAFRQGTYRCPTCKMTI